MTTPYALESDLPQVDLVRLDDCHGDRLALTQFVRELEVRIADEVSDYHDTIEAQINDTLNQIALAVDDTDDHHYNGLVRHLRILQNDQLHFSVTSRPSFMLHQKALIKLRALTGTGQPTTMH